MLLMLSLLLYSLLLLKTFLVRSQKRGRLFFPRNLLWLLLWRRRRLRRRSPNSCSDSVRQTTTGMRRAKRRYR